MFSHWYSTTATDLYEEPGCDEGEAAVLAVESVVVGVEGKVVKVEKPAKHNLLLHTRIKLIPKTCDMLRPTADNSKTQNKIPRVIITYKLNVNVYLTDPSNFLCRSEQTWDWEMQLQWRASTGSVL